MSTTAKRIVEKVLNIVSCELSVDIGDFGEDTEAEVRQQLEDAIDKELGLA